MPRDPRDTAAMVTSLDDSRRRHLADASHYRIQADSTIDAGERRAFLRKASDADTRAGRRSQNIADVKAGRD